LRPEIESITKIVCLDFREAETDNGYYAISSEHVAIQAQM